MYHTSEEALKIIRKIMAKEDLKTQHRLLLDLPISYCNYYNKDRMYNENEVCWIEKTELAQLGIIESNPLYNKERVKFISYSKMTEFKPLSDRTQWRSYQYYDSDSYHLVDERCLKGCRRISVIDNEIYEATIDIPRADKDPHDTIDGKWIKVEPEIA